jgi:hypothetical protein
VCQPCDLLCLDARHRRPVLAVLEEHHVDPLLHHHLQLLHHFVAVVPDADVRRDLLPVVVQLLVQRHLQLQFPGAQHEVLPHHRARLAALFRRRVLHLPDCHRDGAPLVGPVCLALSDEELDVVVHPAGLPLVLEAGLERDRGGSVGGQGEHEGVTIGAQFFDEAVLQLGQVLLVGGGVDLLGVQVEVLLEVEAHHLVLFAAVAEAADYLAEDFAVFVVTVEDHDAICATRQPRFCTSVPQVGTYRLVPLRKCGRRSRASPNTASVWHSGIAF